MKDNFERFTISQAGVLIRDNKCLILEFLDFHGYWDIPGGRIDKGETDHIKAFKREMKEEIGLRDFKIIATVDYDIWQVQEYGQVCVIACLIENTYDEIILGTEHKQYKWITEDEIDDFKFLWPNSPRILKNGYKIDKILKKSEKLFQL